MKTVLVSIVISCISFELVYMLPATEGRAFTAESHNNASAASPSFVSSAGSGLPAGSESSQVVLSGQGTLSLVAGKITNPPVKTLNITDTKTTNNKNSENASAPKLRADQTEDGTETAESKQPESSGDSKTDVDNQNLESKSFTQGNTDKINVASSKESEHNVKIDTGADENKTVKIDANADENKADEEITNASEDNLKQDGNNEDASKIHEAGANDIAESPPKVEKVDEKSEGQDLSPKNDEAVLKEKKTDVSVGKETSTVGPPGEDGQQEEPNPNANEKDIEEQANEKVASVVTVKQEPENTGINVEDEQHNGDTAVKEGKNDYKTEDFDGDGPIESEPNVEMNAAKENPAQEEQGLDNQDSNHGFGSQGVSQNTFNMNDEGSHFFAYFLTVMVTAIVFYLVFHNKQRILALIIEGRSERSRRRPGRSQYRKLDNNLEEAMTATKHI